MATNHSNRTNFVVNTENGIRRLFWVSQTLKRELLIHPRGGVAIYPDHNGLPNYKAKPTGLVHRKFTVHSLKDRAAVSCISLSTEKADGPLEKSIIPTSAILDGGHALVYAYYGGTLNHNQHRVNDGLGNRIFLASVDQAQQSLFYAIFVSRSECRPSIEIPPHFNNAICHFDKFTLTVANIVIPVPTIGQGLSYFSQTCSQKYFTENEFIPFDYPLNSFSPHEAGQFCAFQLFAMTQIVVEGVSRNNAA